MYKLLKVRKVDIVKLNNVASILNACGRDMARKYSLYHWDNPYIKTLVIVLICNLKNDVFLLYDDLRPVATFMTNKSGEMFHFEKFGTLPSESGHGAGSFCMMKIEDIARKAGCKKVSMEVYEPSRHAIAFYEHRGYKIIGRENTLKYKEVKMEKGLSG